MILFIDTHTVKGGGQVVLEQLIKQLVSEQHSRTGLLMPEAGLAGLELPGACLQFVEFGDIASALSRDESIVLVANANRAFPYTLKLSKKLKRLGYDVTTVAIVHNYSVTFLKRAIVSISLVAFDVVFVVEPGLRRFSKKAICPAFLAPIAEHSVLDSKEPLALTGSIKSYGRPDPSKGLHLLAGAYPVLQEMGFECRVAFGQSIEKKWKYTRRLKRALEPWLEPNYKTSDWIEPGDIFLVPSTAGETVCLAAQEAMLNGAYVITSDVGAMAYLTPEGGGHSVTPMGDFKAIVREVGRIQSLSDITLDKEIRRSAEQIKRRSGIFYQEVCRSLLQFEQSKRCNSVEA